MWALARGILLAVGLGVSATAWLSTTSADEDPGVATPSSTTRGVDPRVRAFVQAYGPLIDSVTYDEDVVFSLGADRIHFRDGRMISEDHLDSEAECDPIFYRYPIGPLTAPPPMPDSQPTYCTDVLESLFGSTEREIREHGRSVTFLDHRMFVNELLVDPLAVVEAEIRSLARRDRGVARWVDELNVTYSFSFRDIAGSGNRSQHAWGLAVDLVPTSYHGRAVYWRWSRALDRQGWFRIPMEERWSPPQPIVDAFERHGFVWGGKWPRFDAIHFEYRPEILLYNRLAAAEQ